MNRPRTESINCCPAATTAQVLESVLETLNTAHPAASGAQKIAALEAAIAVVSGDQHAQIGMLIFPDRQSAQQFSHDRITRSLKQWARSDEEARAGVAEPPPTLEQVLDDAIAHRDLNAVKRLAWDIVQQPGAIQSLYVEKLCRAFGRTFPARDFEDAAHRLEQVRRAEAQQHA